MKILIGFMSAVLFGVLTFGISSLYGDNDYWARVILAASLASWAYTLWLIILDHREHYIMMCVALFSIFGIILPAMFQSAGGFYPWWSIGYPSEVVFRAAVILLVYSAFTSCAYLIMYPRMRLKIAHQSTRVFLNRNLALVGVVAFAVIGVVGVFAIGVQYFETSRRSVVFLVMTQGGKSPIFMIVQTIVRDMGFFSLALLAALFAEKRVSLTPLLFVSAIALAGNFFTNNPFNVARFNTIALFLALLPLYFSTRKPLFKVPFIIAYFTGMLLVLPVLDILSRGGAGAVISTDFFSIYRKTVDFDGFQSMMNVILWVDSQGLNWGHQLLSAIFFFVPSDIWAGKGIATGSEGAMFMRYPMVNISSPLPIEIYADFGFAGVMMLTPLLGVCIAWLDVRMEGASLQGYRVAKLPYALLAGYAAILLRGPLISVVGPAVSAFVLSLVLVRVFSMQTRALPRHQLASG